MADQHNRAVGAKGEEMAVSYLEDQGYIILDQNYAYERAEVDIVTYRDTEIVFVEVKMRRGSDFGQPEDAVDEKKKKSIFKAAEAWMYERKMEGSPVRFDVIAILDLPGKQAKLTHYENAFY